jgi:hypothetical protein
MKSIGGKLGCDAYGALVSDDGRLRAFQIMTREEQAAAIRRLANSGMSEHGIARATRLSVELIRHVLSGVWEPSTARTTEAANE